MTTNRDELLARTVTREEINGALAGLTHGGNMVAVTREFFERLCATAMRALPQRPEGAAVAPKIIAWLIRDQVGLWKVDIMQGDNHPEAVPVVIAPNWAPPIPESPPASAVAEPVDLSEMERACCWLPPKPSSDWHTCEESSQCAPCDRDAAQPAQAATVSEFLSRLDSRLEEFGTANKTYFLLKEAGQYIRELLGKSPAHSLPKYRALPSEGNDYLYGTVDGWNDCIDAALASSPAAPAPVIPESEKG